MQSKGTIKAFSILLTLVCIYQLSFTWVSYHVESKAKEYANGDEKKERTYLDSVASQPVYNLLVKKYTYAECRDNQINLGLDLKGGMNVTLEVSVIELIKSLANFSPDTTFNKAIDDASELQKNSQEDFVTLFGKAFENRAKGGKLAAIFSTKDLQDRITYNSTNEEVLKVIKKEADDAIDRSFNILRTRIDKFGVTQPNIQKLSGGRILIELPGVKEPERVRKLLQGTARLEFWETYESKDILQYLADADKFLKNEIKGILQPDSSSSSDSLQQGIDSLATSADTASKSTADTGKSKSSLLEQVINNEKKDTSAGKDSLGLKESADPSKENPLFYYLRPAVSQDEKGQTFARKGPVVGFAAIKDTAKVNEFLANPGVKAIFPKELKLLWSVKPPSWDKQSKILELIAVKITNRSGRAPLEGDVVTDARQDFGQFNNAPEISMSMNADGAKTWKRMTGENIGKSVAIVLDDYVYSFPTVQGEIPNGRTSITGNFTINEAKDLANILKAGKLPAPARIVEEAIVGPSLGKEAISSGLLSFAIALLLVLVFMVLYYNNAGFVADLALFSNIFFVMGVLASLTAVLTLPGIAGIVLTIGMSVDANILIYERVREEVANGKGLRLAISDGFKHAYSSIIDSNVTTFLTGVILFIFGTGPIQGFATTLCLGIATSMFSAIFITRLIFEWMLATNRTIKFSNRLTEGAFKKVNINFVGKRKYYYWISGTVTAVTIISIFVRGFSYGVDFKGGRTYVIRFSGKHSTEEVRSSLTKAFDGTAPEVKMFKSFSGEEEIKVTTSYLINENSAEADEKVEGRMKEGLLKVDTGYEIVSSQKVGPTIADDIKTSALWAVFFSIIVMFLYILVRFKKWQYGLGATVALIHDVMFLIGCFTLLHGVVPFSLEIDQAFIAAVLTVMGYSMNDTVVVFDRLREYLGMQLNKRPMTETINMAVNSTLSRTINTSLTIFFVLLAIFLFGGEVIRGFSFALLMGIIVGTYSSICIATPIVVDFRKKEEKQ